MRPICEHVISVVYGHPKQIVIGYRCITYTFISITCVMNASISYISMRHAFTENNYVTYSFMNITGMAVVLGPG